MVNWGQPVTNRTSISISLVLYLRKRPIPHEALFNLLRCSLRKVFSFIDPQFWIIFTIIRHLFLLWVSSSGRNDGLWKENNTPSHKKVNFTRWPLFTESVTTNFWKKIPSFTKTKIKICPIWSFHDCRNHYVYWWHGPEHD